MKCSSMWVAVPEDAEDDEADNETGELGREMS
jgi:hypothetical protein